MLRRGFKLPQNAFFSTKRFQTKPKAKVIHTKKKPILYDKEGKAITPNWVQKMNNKRAKALKSTEFSLKDNFPDSNSIEPKPANWGFKQQYSKEKEWEHDQSETDQLNTYRDAKKKLDQITRNDPRNHFLLYSLFKKLNQKEQRIGRTQLLNLMQGIAQSNVLQKQDALLKFNIVSDRFISENHQRSSLYWSLLFEASIDTIVDIEIAQKLLGVAMHYTTAENANDTTTGNAKANSPVQDPSFLWPLCRGLCVNGNPKDAIELLFNYGTCPESYVNHCLSEIFDYYIANEDTEGMMDLFKRVKERRFVLGNYLGHQLLLHLDSLRSNNQEKVKNDMADIQNYLTKESNVLTQGIYRTLYSFAFRTKDTEMLKQLEKEIISHDYDWQQIKTRVKMLDVCENGNELILDKEFNNSITSRDYLLEYKLLGDIMLRYVKDAEKIRDSAIGIHSKDFGLYCSRAFTTQAKALFIRTHVESEIYLRLMELAANNSNQKRAESLLKQAHRRGMNVTAEHYFCVVDALCNRGSVLQCKDIILDMYKEKIKPSIHIYNRLMKAYLDQKPNQKPSGNFVKAFAILEQFPRIWQTPNNETYSIFFKALLKDKKSSNSVKFIEILAAISASPSVKVFNHLMLQSLKEKNIKGVIRYFDLLQQSSENPNPETFEILITAYKQSNEFKIMFKTWNDLDRKFKNQNGYKQILDAYALISDVKKFEKEFFDLKSLKSLDIKICEDVLENMISLDVPVMAIDFIMTEMKSMGLIPNPEILRTLLDLDESAKNSVDKNQAAVKSLDEKKELLKDYIAVVNPKIDKLLEKSIIPWAETDQKKLHDNYVEMDQLFSSTRRESRRRARATNKTV